MANTFVNKKADLTSTDATTLYTVPSATTAVVKSILVSEDSNNDSNILPEGVVGNLSQCIEFISACSKFGVAPQHAAMRYVLDIPAVSVTVPNIRNMDTLIDYCVDFGTDEIPSELYDVIDDL